MCTNRPEGATSFVMRDRRESTITNAAFNAFWPNKNSATDSNPSTSETMGGPLMKLLLSLLLLVSECERQYKSSCARGSSPPPENFVSFSNGSGATQSLGSPMSSFLFSSSFVSNILLFESSIVTFCIALTVHECERLRIYQLIPSEQKKRSQRCYAISCDQ